MNQSKKWPDDYKNWTGNLKELITEANLILNTLSPQENLEVNERLVRFYQSSNVLGRGIKKGRSAEFSYEDLFNLVSTKILAKNTSLLGASLLTSHYKEDFYTSTPVAETLSASVNATPENAVSLVEQLLSKSSSPLYRSPHVKNPPAIFTGATTAIAGRGVDSLKQLAESIGSVPVAVASSYRTKEQNAIITSTPQPLEPLWLKVDLDFNSMVSASQEERDQAEAVLKKSIEMLHLFKK